MKSRLLLLSPLSVLLVVSAYGQAKPNGQTAQKKQGAAGSSQTPSEKLQAQIDVRLAITFTSALIGYPRNDFVKASEVSSKYSFCTRLDVSQPQWLREHCIPVLTLLKNLNYVGGQQGMFVNSPGLVPSDTSLNAPVQVITVGKTSVSMVFGFVSENVFNALRSTLRTRASKVVQELALPILADIHSAFEHSTLNKYGVMVIYGSRDFGDISAPTKMESVAVIVDAPIAKQHFQNLISQDELLRRSEIYLNTDGISFRKVELTLE